MNEITSDLPRKEYLRELKGCFGSPFYIFDERVVGLVIGSFFSVAHWTEYEYDRRFNVHCNRAWGWVKTNPIDGKTEVKFIRGAGYFSLFWIILLACLFPLMILMKYGLDDMTPDDWAIACIVGVVCSLIICGVSALGTVLTERGIYGAGEITKLLTNPEDYYC